MDDLINEFVEVKLDKQLNAITVNFLKFIPFDEFKKIAEHEFKLIPVRGHGDWEKKKYPVSPFISMIYSSKEQKKSCKLIVKNEKK